MESRPNKEGNYELQNWGSNTDISNIFHFAFGSRLILQMTEGRDDQVVIKKNNFFNRKKSILMFNYCKAIQTLFPVVSFFLT